MSAVFVRQVANKDPRSCERPQAAAHYQELQAKTVVKRWTGEEPTVADDVDTLKAQNAQLLARLERLERTAS